MMRHWNRVEPGDAELDDREPVQIVSTDQIRADRQAQRENQIAKLRQRAERLESQAAGKMEEYNRMRGDIAWLTQPGAGTAFGRSRRRIMDRYDQGLHLTEEARKLRERADRLEREGVRVAGDRDQQRQSLRERLDQVIAVGSRIFCPIYGNGVVLKVNRKTYRVRWRNQYELTIDKSLCRPEEETNGGR